MDITVSPRSAQTKGERKSRLKQGFVPGSIYGRGLEPVLIEVKDKSIAQVLLAESGLNTVITMTIQGGKGKHTVVVDNLERDRITRSFLNVGFHEIKKGDKVHAKIPINLVGTVQDVVLRGALLEQTLTALDVTAKASDLPPHIDVDVSQMKTGDVLRVSDLPHNPKLAFVTHEESAIAAVHVSTTAQQVEEDAATAAEDMPQGKDALTELRADADASSDSVTGTDSAV